jgi:dynein light intermediate chain 1
MPEQAFLAKHYDENARKPDSRMSSGNPADLAGVVGPLQSSSFSLPNVDRALSDMETGIGVAAPPISSNAEARRLGSRTSAAAPRPAGLGASISRPATASSPISSPSPTGQSQHEVLQNFFQSLLTNKDRSAASAGTRAAAAKANGASAEDGGAS